MSLDTVVASVNKRLGEGTLLRGHDLRNYDIPRVTSGALSLDLALGGGWPLNCWNSIEGEPSNGKTVLALKSVAANQSIHKEWTTLWIAAEPFVVPWATACGVDMDQMIVADTQVMEDGFQIAVEMLDGRLIDCLVIDSLSSLVPTEEDEKAMDDVQVALGARITGKFMRKSNSAQKRSLTDPDRHCLCLMISQWREKVGVMWGDNRVTPYGRAKEFFYMTRMEVRRDEWLGPEKERVGLTFKARMTKNKTAPPQRVATVDFYWQDTPLHRAGSYDIGKMVANIAMDLGIVEQRGSTYRFDGRVWRGKEALFQAIETDQILLRSLDKAVRHRVSVMPGLAGAIDVDIITESVATAAPRRRLKRA